MRRANHLFDAVATQENLRKAFRKAAKGKRRKREVIDFQKDFDANIQNLREQILSGQLVVGRYRFFTVKDPKTRTICAAAFPERVLHHAIMNLCEPIFDRNAIFDSYACRKGKGNRRALARAEEFARRSGWYLKLDIKKYFDSIDHNITMRMLSKRFREKKLLNLFESIIRAYQTEPGRGVPIGNLISQHLANFYLGPLDRRIKETRRIKGYLRYMDDFILFGTTSQALKAELTGIEDFLTRTLKLTLKENIQINRCSLGIPFLGFRVFPNLIRLSPRSLYRYSQKFREYERSHAEGIWSENQMIRHIEPLNEFIRACNSLRIRRQIHQRFGVLS